MKIQGIAISEICLSVKISVRTFYHWKKQRNIIHTPSVKKLPPVNKLKPKEVAEIKKILRDPKLSDLNPREIYYKMLDENRSIVASTASIYRIAKSENLLTKRIKTSNGKALNREKPHLVACEINQIWSWDVTQIQSTSRNIRFYLYVIMDIWSRYVVGWILKDHEQTECAIDMWKMALEQQSITGKGLTNHKDNGSIMRSDEMIKFVKDLEMVDSYSRAGVSDDNPFSESLFKTIKYFKDFPGFFPSLENGEEYFKKYFSDYNDTHMHSGIQFLTPTQRHLGEEERILNARNTTIKEFHDKNPHRYSSKHKIFFPIKVVNIN